MKQENRRPDTSMPDVQRLLANGDVLDHEVLEHHPIMPGELPRQAAPSMRDSLSSFGTVNWWCNTH